jgi:hypothetical protein
MYLLLVDYNPYFVPSGQIVQKTVVLLLLFINVILFINRGYITALKLSPNLRKKVKPPKKGPVHTEKELELMKLEKLLALVREPPTLTTLPDLPAPVDT